MGRGWNRGEFAADGGADLLLEGAVEIPLRPLGPIPVLARGSAVASGPCVNAPLRGEFSGLQLEERQDGGEGGADGGGGGAQSFDTAFKKRLRSEENRSTGTRGGSCAFSCMCLRMDI